jgi:hypothetical protein
LRIDQLTSITTSTYLHHIHLSRRGIPLAGVRLLIPSEEKSACMRNFKRCNP